MPRYLLTIEYDGRPFVGWQKQDNGLAVQTVMERAASALEDGYHEVYGAGRTDSGVHALAMTAHVNFEKHWPDDVVRDALNHHMRAHPVSVLSARRVKDDTHARFSARKRGYIYRIIDRRAPLTLDAGRAWQIRVPLDVNAMNMAAQNLVGRHDFTTFRHVHCQAESPVKSIDRISVERLGSEIVLSVEAISFLHRQIRSITGSLVEVGRGRWSVEDFRDALAAADRTRCGPVAPADGLYLAFVNYPPAALESP